MHSKIDHHGGDTHHGYTEDDDGNVWYWEWDGSKGPVEFRENAGYPIDHPIKSGGVPDEVRDHANTHVGAIIDQMEFEDRRIPWG